MDKFHQKSIFESGFDSFEFDDGFLMRLDSDLKKNKISEKHCDATKINSKEAKNEDYVLEKKKEKIHEMKTHFFDLPLFIKDLNDSDFFDFNVNKKPKGYTKVVSTENNGKSRKTSVGDFKTCLSPIQGPKSTSNLSLSSSTPVKPNTNSNSKEMITNEEKYAKNFDYVYSEADLFDDWDVNEIKKEGTPKSTVTLSQALKLIEEAEVARDSNRKEFLNRSINLLTGEIVGTDMGVMFDEPFDVPESGPKKENSQSSCDSVVILEESKSSWKPAAAQKLNFESDEVNCFNSATEKENQLENAFISDDDFDFIPQDLLDRCKEVSTKAKHNNVTPLKACDLNESTDGVINFKRNRSVKIIESDTTEDSPSPKFRRQITKKRKNYRENFAKEFIVSEAEVSDEVKVSSDEAEEEGEYDKSFLDEESYFTQNQSANMTSKYLESVKALTGPGSFKIPAAKPFNHDDIFSQIPEENDTDYEIDSFCVNEVEEEMTSDLSDLEVAEEILEMDKKKRKRKRSQKHKKLK